MLLEFPRTSLTQCVFVLIETLLAVRHRSYKAKVRLGAHGSDEELLRVILPLPPTAVPRRAQLLTIRYVGATPLVMDTLQFLMCPPLHREQALLLPRLILPLTLAWNSVVASNRCPLRIRYPALTLSAPVPRGPKLAWPVSPLSLDRVRVKPPLFGGRREMVQPTQIPLPLARRHSVLVP